MLTQRILSTIKFFDLQNLPLTFGEVFKYLLGQPELNGDHELEGLAVKPLAVDSATVYKVLDDLVIEGRLICHHGFYSLPGKNQAALHRVRSFANGVKREKRLARYINFVRNIPFVRGVALAGSQAFGVLRAESDIDLFIITDQRYLWLPRTLITGYFQIFGVRRHGALIKNRFCLNHYLAGTHTLSVGRNLYTALEYSKLRPLSYTSAIYTFQKNNLVWIEQFFPHLSHYIPAPNFIRNSFMQRSWEHVLDRTIGSWLERILGNWQQSRIQHQKHIITKNDELSFHPNSKQDSLLGKFYGQNPKLEAPSSKQY